MVLRNAFANVATESTLDEIKIEQFTIQRELLEEIVKQLRLLNLHMSMINDEQYSTEDLDQENQ